MVRLSKQLHSTATVFQFFRGFRKGIQTIQVKSGRFQAFIIKFVFNNGEGAFRFGVGISSFRFTKRKQISLGGECKGVFSLPSIFIQPEALPEDAAVEFFWRCHGVVNEGRGRFAIRVP